MKRSAIYTIITFLTATNLFAEFHLQEAIDNASSGDTIIIPSGTYTQPITIDKPITLDGRDAVLKVEANRPAPCQLQITACYTSKTAASKDSTTPFNSGASRREALKTV